MVDFDVAIFYFASFYPSLSLSLPLWVADAPNGESVLLVSYKSMEHSGETTH